MTFITYNKWEYSSVFTDTIIWKEAIIEICDFKQLALKAKWLPDLCEQLLKWPVLCCNLCWLLWTTLWNYLFIVEIYLLIQRETLFLFHLSHLSVLEWKLQVWKRGCLFVVFPVNVVCTCQSNRKMITRINHIDSSLYCIPWTWRAGLAAGPGRWMH